MVIFADQAALLAHARLCVHIAFATLTMYFTAREQSGTAAPWNWNFKAKIGACPARNPVRFQRAAHAWRSELLVKS